jgi:hypothetical protein
MTTSTPITNDHNGTACLHCGYYHGYTDDYSGGTGDCHRYPPIFAGEHIANEKHRWKHPSVAQSDWCGEFKPRIQD